MNSNVCDEEMNNPQELHIFNKELLNDHMTKNDIANREESNECFKKPKMEEDFNNGKLLDVSDVSDTLKEEQWKILDHDGGDGLKLNYENKIQLETIEKKFEGLKIQNELIADEIQLITNLYKLRNDLVAMVKDQINKVQNKMEQIHIRKIKNELENVICFKTIVDKMMGMHSHINQFKVTVNGLETSVEEAGENKKIMTEIMEVAEYMKNQYNLQMAEDQRHFTEQINKNAGEIDQLKADVGIKAIEPNDWEKRYANQEICVDSHEELMKRVEKYMAGMLSIIYSYLKQLEDENNQLAVPNEKQKDIVLLLAIKIIKLIRQICRNNWKKFTESLETIKDPDMTNNLNIIQFMDNHE